MRTGDEAFERLLLQVLGKLDRDKDRLGWGLRHWSRHYRENPTAATSRRYRTLRSYRSETLQLLLAALEADISIPEARYLLSHRIPETELREYVEFSSLVDSDPDENWAFIRALHLYPIRDLGGVADLTGASDRTKAICRSLIAATLAIFDRLRPEDRVGVTVGLRPSLSSEPVHVIVHKELLQLIQAHPEGGETIAAFIRSRGIDGIPAARTALDDATHAALSQGVL